MKRITRYAVVLSLSLVSLGLLGFLVRGSMLPAPSSGTWAPTPGVLAEARSGAAAAMLSDGRVLVTGGDGAAGAALSSAEVFSLDGAFTPVAPMSFARSKHVAVALKDGRVLVAGGVGIDGSASNSAEIYDPSSNVWQAAGAMLEARSGATATLLSDGRVLVAGGASGSVVSPTLEVFDPVSDSFVPGGVMSSPRQDHAAARLADDRILLIGGSTGDAVLGSSELWDSASGQIVAGPAMSVPRQGLSATTLIDGTVLLAGGNDGTNDLAVTEIFDPAAGTVVAGASLLSSARRDHLAVLLPHNASVLMVGGTALGVPVAGAELYIPWSGGSNPTGSPAAARALAVASPTGTDGLLLLAGGKDAAGATLNSGEVYGFATVKTDKDDYVPGDQVLISGAGWEPNDTVNLTLPLRLPVVQMVAA
ncbi:MAG: kelch repeat-containing protein, partial [Terriglobia bacterium]